MSLREADKKELRRLARSPQLREEMARLSTVRRRFFPEMDLWI